MWTVTVNSINKEPSSERLSVSVTYTDGTSSFDETLVAFSSATGKVDLQTVVKLKLKSLNSRDTIATQATTNFLGKTYTLDANENLVLV